MEQLHRIVVPTPFAVGDVNMYIIEGDRLTLIDAGVKTEEAWHVFVRELRELGYSHAQSHIVLYRESDGLMIGGDHLLATISSNPLLEPPAIGEQERLKPLLQYNDSLKKLLNYDITMIVTGHGEDVTDVAPLIEKRLEKQKERAQYVWQLLSEKPMTAFDVCRALFPTVYEREFLLTMSETIGQLDYLEAIGTVKKEKDGQIYMYEVVGS